MRQLHLLLACWAIVGAARAGERRPNLVLILADDMGHGHVRCLNPAAKIPTPHIDRFAQSGMTFTDAHSGSAVCSPTRYGLLTGRYAWRTRLKAGVLGPYDRPLIEADRLTLPAMLREQGYRTACIGKWHLGWDWPRSGGGEPDFNQPIAGGPTTRGFDYYFGTDVPNYPPYCFIENERTVGQPSARKTATDLDGRPGPMLPGWQFDAILPTLADRAVEYIRQRANDERPFFLYLSLTSPHEPIAPSQGFRGKSGLNPLADFIIETDAVVGKVLQALHAGKLEKNTLVIVTADNGSSTYSGGAELRKLGHAPSAGFRGFKGQIYEGGHRVPFFVRWPGTIAPASRCDDAICLTDVMATVAAILETPLPEAAAEDSVSFLPALMGDRNRPLRPAVVHQASNGQLAVRQGPWKLILPSPPPATQAAKSPAKPQREPSVAELYNLSLDPAESTNVIGAHPQLVQELTALLTRYHSTGRSR